MRSCVAAYFLKKSQPKVGLQLHFGWATVHPGNCLSNINPGEVLKIPFFTGLFRYEKRLFSELRTSHRNPNLKAVDYVIHRKLHDSRKTTWFTEKITWFTENYVIHGKLLRDSRKTTWFTENYVIHGKLCDSRKTTWFTENYVIHGKLRDSRGPCRDYVGILIFFVKNYVIHVKLHDSRKLRDSRKTTWFTENYVIHVKLRDSLKTRW
jgi:hypothetical protein